MYISFPNVYTDECLMFNMYATRMTSHARTKKNNNTAINKHCLYGYSQTISDFCLPLANCFSFALLPIFYFIDILYRFRKETKNTEKKKSLNCVENSFESII